MGRAGPDTWESPEFAARFRRLSLQRFAKNRLAPPTPPPPQPPAAVRVVVLVGPSSGLRVSSPHLRVIFPLARLLLPGLFFLRLFFFVR